MSGPPRHAPNTANHAPNCVALEVKRNDGKPLEHDPGLVYEFGGFGRSRAG
jgi:hypothetical protein